MAESHRDDDAPESAVLLALREEAQKLSAAGKNKITAGAPDEKPLMEESVGAIWIRKLPDDPLALRISIGEGHLMQDSAYLVFRGNDGDVLALLERSVAALRASHFLV